MERTFWKLLQLVVATAVLCWGATQVQAGPGGGTYYANSPAGGTSGNALRKFVDKLPGLGLPGCTMTNPPGAGTCNENNLGSYIPVASPITGAARTAAGVPADASDYYEIGVVEYSQKMHSDLPKKTRLRGYRDLNLGFTNMSTQYLGPLILAKKGVPVRVKMKNLLPTGAQGKLFIPVDTSLMGAGPGPYADVAGTTVCTQPIQRLPNDPAPAGTLENCPTNVPYSQNRATFHLHGGNSPWISDGTPHQWTVPAGEVTPYKKGVSTRDVPDMPATADGEMTFFWTNQQGGRLMFYHDHSLGITRLNVYAGEAAGYLLTDQVEDDLIDGTNLAGGNPGAIKALPNLGGIYRYGIPLVIQDKTFVPKNIDIQDALWTKNSLGAANNWGVYGDLWFPHVYERNQDPTSPAGANPFGRWDYGPWFWPPVAVPPDKATLPEPSTTPEAFMDTMVVNGTAYPYLTVEPKPYRFRILNACNDRMLNLSLFVADPNDPLGTEVKMVPAAPNPTFPAGPFPQEAVWPTDGRAGGVPDPATRGPNIIQIGNESGLLMNPVVHPNQPVNYNYNRRDIVVLNVQEKNLFLGSAERADVIIDFSDPKYIGKNIILYNDSPAPVPASDPRVDYYTGNPDQTASGGAPSTLRGFGPNTRTIMQFRVAGTPTPAPNLLTNLNTALPTAFKASQPAPLVPEPTHPLTAWGGITAPTEQYAKISDYAITLKPLNSDYSQRTIPVTIPFQSKAIQELWDPYGRMNATLGIELPFTNQFNQTTIPMGYAEPTTETIVDGHPQIWKITHNGVDTHPVHFHMFDVQVINRVGWDGAIRPADDNELGWKETVRMNPLEDIIVAIRPKAQSLPASWPALNPDNAALPNPSLGPPLPKSTRRIDPTLPQFATDGVTPVKLLATDIGNLGGGGTPRNGLQVVINNAPADYGYEYVWHCHILGHEENDFMRPMVFTSSTAQAPQPTGLAGYLGGATVPGLVNYVQSYTNPNINQIVLQWADAAPVTTPSRFLVLRATGAGPYTYPGNLAPIAEISFLPGYPPIYTDTSIDPGTTYGYGVVALNDYPTPDSPSAFNPALHAITVASPTWTAATGVTITDSKPIGHVVGTNVQFTATGTGATSSNPALAVVYEYRFSLQCSGASCDPLYLTKQMVQDFSNNNVWTLPDTSPIGSYTISVEARTSANQTPLAASSVTHVVNNPPTPPTTVASPVPAVYSAAPVVVTLTATAPNPNVPVQGIYYTLDGTTPTTAMPPYTGPITLTQTTTINYMAVDINGTAETVHSDTWFIHVPDLVATMQINGGATLAKSLNVTLDLNAFDPVGVSTMEFSNDGTNWSGEEPYATKKLWTLTAGSDGPRTVYARFRDKSLPTGVQYPPITATVTLDTTPPVTSVSPIPGPYSPNQPVFVTLTTNETAAIYYTTDGTTPSTASSVYALPIPVNVTAGTATTIKYFAVDSAGNQEAVQTGTWTMTTQNLTNASITINNGVTWTPVAGVTLTLTGLDPTGIASYELSNDGVTWSGPFAWPGSPATTTWTLTSGEGLKTVYVRYTDTDVGAKPYAPITATILLGTKDGLLPGTISHLASGLKALQIASGYLSPTPMDLVHADVAPYSGGAANPDGKIDLLDVYTIMLHQVGLISTF